MFGFIRSWFYRRDSFQFFDGKSKRQADPFRVWGRLLAIEGFRWERFNDLDSQDDGTAMAASEECTAWIREAFQVQEFNDGGLMRHEQLALMQAFLLFVDDIKKKHAPLQTQPRNTESNTDSESGESSESKPREKPILDLS